ncbi:hypothetical protein HPB49_007608 [Dermacentor silvarum]|uniref:Uncharacterized protein n=1 Tax=Dermacentor silvarum TaxID=543639 RepID=A0ACB8DXA5_DERSI|nr:hypothetical protein HPB49_007608 [Dermacentor silvarum]
MKGLWVRDTRIKILDARILGTSTTALLTTDGPHLPRLVYHGGCEYPWHQFRPARQFCQMCMQSGHRPDVCPNLNTPPKCGLCGGQHETGTKECPKRLKPARMLQPPPARNNAEKRPSRLDGLPKIYNNRWFYSEDSDSASRSQSRSRSGSGTRARQQQAQPPQIRTPPTPMPRKKKQQQPAQDTTKQRERRLSTATGRHILKRIGYPADLDAIQSTTNIPTSYRARVHVAPLPKNMSQSHNEGRRNARVDYLKRTVGRSPRTVYVDAALYKNTSNAAAAVVVDSSYEEVSSISIPHCTVTEAEAAAIVLAVHVSARRRAAVRRVASGQPVFKANCVARRRRAALPVRRKQLGTGVAPAAGTERKAIHHEISSRGPDLMTPGPAGNVSLGQGKYITRGRGKGSLSSPGYPREQTGVLQTDNQYLVCPPNAAQ